jgi:hypothetical protein
MTLGINVTTRNNILTQIENAIDAGVSAGALRIYDGVRPATGGTATNLLVALPCTKPSASGIASAVLTFAAITTTNASLSGTATWFRFVDSAGTFVLDGSVGTSGADLNLTTTALVATQPVSISSGSLTAGNA